MTQWTLSAQQWRKLFCLTSWVWWQHWCSVITYPCMSVSNSQVVNFAVDFGGTAAEFGMNLLNFCWVRVRRISMTKHTVSRGCLLLPVFSTVAFKQLGVMLSGCLPCATFGSLRERRRGCWASWGPWGGKFHPLSSLLFHPMRKEETDRHFSPGEKEYLCEEARNVFLLTVRVTGVVTWSWLFNSFFSLSSQLKRPALTNTLDPLTESGRPTSAPRTPWSGTVPALELDVGESAALLPVCN